MPGRAHGTAGRYDQGCRCDMCVEHNRLKAWSYYHNMKPTDQRARKRQMKARDHALREDVPHGTLDGYTNHACRCWECTETGSSYARVRAGGSKPKNKTPKYGTKHSTGNGLAAIQKGFVE